MPNLAFPISFSSFFCLYTKMALRYAVKRNSLLYTPFPYNNLIEETTIIILLYSLYYQVNLLARKNPLKRDQALNDATSGQIGEEPRSVPEQTSDLKNERMKTARKMSRDM